MTDVFELLKEDHRKVLDLIGEINCSDEKMEDNFNELKEALKAHMEGEEMHFYPVLEKNEDLEELALEAFEEHKHAKSVLNDLSKTAMDDRKWMPMFHVMTQMLCQHINSEEIDMFPMARKALTADQNRNIADKIVKMHK